MRVLATCDEVQTDSAQWALFDSRGVGVVVVGDVE